MEAGNYMHEFSIELFRQLDSGLPVDNLYMINGHFQDTLRQLFETNKLSTPHYSIGERLNITFP
jgi:hypothetical protein